MKKSIAIIALAATAAVSQAFTVATFADPSPGGAQPLFTVTNTTVFAQWLGLGLTLEIPNLSTQYTDVTFTSTVIPRVGTVIGAGSIQFFDNAAAPLMTVTFDSGVIFEPVTSAASYILSNNVTFTGPAVAGLGPMNFEQFAFAFANPGGNVNERTYTASYTSSAVPEPATLLAMGLGGVALLRRRRK